MKAKQRRLAKLKAQDEAQASLKTIKSSDKDGAQTEGRKNTPNSSVQNTKNAFRSSEGISSSNDSASAEDKSKNTKGSKQNKRSSSTIDNKTEKTLEKDKEPHDDKNPFLGPISQLIESDTKAILSSSPQTSAYIRRKTRALNRMQSLKEPKKQTIKVEPVFVNKEEQYEELIKMFNLDISNEKIKLEENSEYYDMRIEIAELIGKIGQAKQEYEYIVEQNKQRCEHETKVITDLEMKLKNMVEENVELIKTDNKICAEDIDILDKRLSGLKAMLIKDQHNYILIEKEFSKTIEKLQRENDLVNSLKKKLVSLSEKEIPRDLKNKIEVLIGSDKESTI